MMSPQMVRLDKHLQRLRLNTVRERLEALLQEAAEKELSEALKAIETPLRRAPKALSEGRFDDRLEGLRNQSYRSWARRLRRPGDCQRDPRPDPASRDDISIRGVSAQGQAEVRGGQADDSRRVTDGRTVDAAVAVDGQRRTTTWPAVRGVAGTKTTP